MTYALVTAIIMTIITVIITKNNNKGDVKNFWRDGRQGSRAVISL